MTKTAKGGGGQAPGADRANIKKTPLASRLSSGNKGGSERREVLRWVPVRRCVALRRNPQYLSPHTMEALKASIDRDGFLAPVLVRPLPNGDYEVVSGNHRVMAARELGHDKVPAVVVADMTDTERDRVAVNLNTVHGDPTAELLAPFLAEIDSEALKAVHLSDDLLAEVKKLDESLAERFASLEVPEAWNQESVKTEITKCVCPTCGKHHIRGRRDE